MGRAEREATPMVEDQQALRDAHDEFHVVFDQYDRDAAVGDALDQPRDLQLLGRIQSRRRLRYRAGQGVVGRFAGYFTAGVANSIQVMGYGHAEDGFYFGYNGTSFGILYSNRGVREVRTLTITTASTATRATTSTHQ